METAFIKFLDGPDKGNVYQCPEIFPQDEIMWPTELKGHPRLRIYCEPDKFAYWVASYRRVSIDQQIHYYRMNDDGQIDYK